MHYGSSLDTGLHRRLEASAGLMVSCRKDYAQMDAMALSSITLLLFMMLCSLQVMSQSDMQCLKDFSQSVNDPQGDLRDWSSSDASKLCTAFGVQCLHPEEVKVYSISVPGAGLGGTFPKGLEKCTSLTGLDLSGNSFTGPIPDTLCKMLPYLVKLDLSGNQITGQIPDSLGDCMYLNELHLQQNSLSGGIPGQIGLLPRLSVFNASNNKLTGQIPDTFVNRRSSEAAFQMSSFQNNRGLCGPPLSDCNSSSKANVGLIVGIVVGGIVVILAVTGIVVRRILAKRQMKDDTTWVKKIKGPRSITVSMFEKPLVRIKLSDLMAATENFSKDNVIGDGPTGVSYKAILRDGSVLAIKRLRASHRSEQQFRSAMETLGNVRHSNLVPLLGYCIAGSERLLIYKHMTNGSLWNWLYEVDAGERLDWPARLRIGLGTARGLAFLHHSCNPRILHRNISPHTILLDDDFEARITDFGLTRLMGSSNDHVNAEVLGEFGDPGHVAPEYARIPITTSKGDVYSFGVVLLELLTSQKPLDICMGDFRGSLVEWVGMLYNTGRSSEAIDKSLTGRGVDEELLQALKVACGCVLFLPKDRPSMYEVFLQLRNLGERYDFTNQDDDIPLAPNGAEMESGDPPGQNGRS